ncbi:hypothetical protein [Sulfurimonas sp.]|uniref:hypothetical protein n=1 Tax=Sulfurimonas sp. TaxID=2022749 RepID=UPI00262D471A|nr:hypothetical protein [Sulfurimonas sp.]MCW8896282.1 hypothetical protein [Sulfurimonas sp.]
MKPLLKKDLPTFLKRFGNFVDCEFRSIDITSPTTMLVTLAAQDSARGFDWLSIKLEFSGVSDARVLENSKLSLIDTDEGINIIYEDDKYVFGIGNYTNLSSIQNSTCYITSSTLKYEEGAF